MNQQKKHRKKISTWRQFAKHVRSKGCCLLSEMGKFPDAILVTGCQRSGTTLMARIIFNSDGIENIWKSSDDELDAALILSGYEPHEPRGRYCFQSTYLNQCYTEYFSAIQDQKIIWVLRNPESVVNSLVYNWDRFARNELFEACGVSYMDGPDKQKYQKYGHLTISRLKKACYSYVGKTSQLFELMASFSGKNVFVVDYDDLVKNKEAVLPAIYEFINLEYRNSYGDFIRERSLKKADRLTKNQCEIINRICASTYKKAKNYIVETP